MSFKPLTIASRQSPLAMAQAHLVQSLLTAAVGLPDTDREAAFPIISFVTTGDKMMNPSLSEIGGKGLFTKEVEAALLEKRADIAVHSMKDMPAQMPTGLTLAAVPEREDPRDAFVTLDGRALDDMPAGSKIGTSSVRRRAQLARMRPDLTLVPLRGNVGTRLTKLKNGDADGTFLAAAGLNRLGDAVKDVPRQMIAPDVMLPAPGQGALCLQTRDDDEAALALCAKLNDPAAALAMAAERALVAALDGSCRTPIAGFAHAIGDTLMVEAEILSLDGRDAFRETREIPLGDKADAQRTDLAARGGDGLARSLADTAGPDFIAQIHG